MAGDIWVRRASAAVDTALFSADAPDWPHGVMIGGLLSPGEATPPHFQPVGLKKIQLSQPWCTHLL